MKSMKKCVRYATQFTHKYKNRKFGSFTLVISLAENLLKIIFWWAVKACVINCKNNKAYCSCTFYKQC